MHNLLLLFFFQVKDHIHHSHSLLVNKKRPLYPSFHNQVDELAAEQRAVVDLLWYEGMSQPDAAKVLGISLATLKRRWQAARLQLSDHLKQHWIE